MDQPASPLRSEHRLLPSTNRQNKAVLRAMLEQLGVILFGVIVVARIDIERVRADTPGCRNVVHFNNAGAALIPRPVYETVQAHQRLEAEIGGYEAAAEHADDLDAVYDSIARLLSCDPGEIALVENATRAWDMVAYAVPLRPGDRILTAKADYASNTIALLQLARKTGAILEVIPDDPHGQVSIEALAETLDDDVKLVALTHVPTNGGLVNPAADVGRLVRDHPALYLLDACQSAGQLPLDVAELGCDALSVTGRKYLRGPRGTGFLYVRKELIETLEPPLLDLHAARLTSPESFEIRGDARRFECWEANLAARLGLGAAIDYALDLGLVAIAERIADLAGTLRKGLAAIPGVGVHDLGLNQCGIVSFTSEGRQADAIKESLRVSGINTSVTDRSSTLLDMGARGLRKMVRASVHYYNTHAEVSRFLEEIERSGTGTV